MIIDQVFIALFALCCALNKDGLIVGASLIAALLFDYYSGLYTPYCLLFAVILFTIFKNKILNPQTKSIFCLLIIVDSVAFLDYFNVSETVIYTFYQPVVFVLKSLLIISIFRAEHERRDLVDDCISSLRALFSFARNIVNINDKADSKCKK